MTRTLFASLLGALLTHISSAQPTTPPKPLRKPLEKVSAADYRAHVQYLADDKLQGRLPGTAGYQLAVDYVIGQYKKYGVQPAGEKGTYLQTVQLRRAFTEPGATLRLQPPQGAELALTYGPDFTFYPNPAEVRTTVTAPLVFAGFGISALELGYDDYAGLDATGKIVVVTRQEPKQFPDAVRLYNTDLLTVLQTAARHGAVGVLLAAPKASVKPPDPAKGLVSVIGADGKVAVSRTYGGPQLRVVGSISAAILQQLFRGAATDTTRALAALRAGKPAPVLLLPRLTAAQQTRHQDVKSYNVIGEIPGSDPALRKEYVVHTAHLDHLGVGAPIEGDSIYNGAHDNATGVASLLEIAGVYSRLKEKPRRSVLLAMVTGEEMGLLGSAYFARNPTVPKSQIVANINTDMPTIIAPLLSVVALGAENSSLAMPVAEATRMMGLSVEADPEPTQNRFIRSDQYSFVTQGMNGIFNFEAGRNYTQLNFLIGYLIANDPQRPTWNAGNFFGERFAKSN